MQIRAGSKWLDPSHTLDNSGQDNVVVCEKCGCSWMELILVQQYNRHFQVVLGQKPVPKDNIGYWLFRCPKCNEVWEPPISVGSYDSGRKGYDQFINHMLEPIPSSSKL